MLHEKRFAEILQNNLLPQESECTATHIHIHIILLRTNVLLNASISLHITHCKLNLILHNFMTRYLFFIVRNIGFAFLFVEKT